MSTYIDPATALRIARNARADEIRSAEQARLARTAKPRGGGSTAKPRRRLRAKPTFTRPAIAH
jgi:hypothetical protein